MKYYWKCHYCQKNFVKNTPQGLGLARSNHLRKHGVWTSRKISVRDETK